MTFAEATAYLASLVNYERTPAQMATERYLNLDRMRELLAAAGNPHHELRCVHIAGTKGKGSTASLVAAILRAAGLRVGLYTSPHLVTVRERIRIDGEPISEDALATLVGEVQPIVERLREREVGLPTYFEVYTLLAFRWFAQQHVDIAVLETGMGGRLDATNVVQPLVAGITTLALDHTVELGNTLALIAGEKAGIIKAGVPTVTAPQETEAERVIERTAQKQHSPLFRVGKELLLHPGSQLIPGMEVFTIEGRLGRYDDLHLPLLGEHQQINAAVAVGIAECLHEAGLPISPDSIRTGLASVQWPGRLQVLQNQPLVVLDGAHDPAAIDALLAALDRHFAGRKRYYVVGFNRDKDWPQMLRQLAPSAASMMLAAAATARAVPPEDLLPIAQQLGIRADSAPSVAEAAEHMLGRIEPDALLCITGSLYLVGEALQWWEKRR